MEIRKANKENAKKISMLIRNTIRKINSSHYPKKQMDNELKAYATKKIEKYFDSKLIFIMIDKEEIIGTSILDQKEEALDSLYLSPKYLGKGLGKKLLRFMEELAKKKGIKVLTLYPTEYAMKFYESQGYKKVDEFIGTRNGGFPVIDMKKRL